MKIELYNHDTHYSTLCTWLADKAIPKPNPAFLSSIGLVIDHCAIGFLFMTNSKLCIIDCISADPKISKERRSQALNYLLKTLEEIASEQGYKIVQMWTALPKMKDRLISLDYIDRGPHTIFTKEVN
jgi:hypothetical protein